MKKKDWIIIDVEKGEALYGFRMKTMMFSSKETAEEVASQLYETSEKWITVNVSQGLRLTLHKI